VCHGRSRRRHHKQVTFFLSSADGDRSCDGFEGAGATVDGVCALLASHDSGGGGDERYDDSGGGGGGAGGAAGGGGGGGAGGAGGGGWDELPGRVKMRLARLFRELRTDPEVTSACDRRTPGVGGRWLDCARPMSAVSPASWGLPFFPFCPFPLLFFPFSPFVPSSLSLSFLPPFSLNRDPPE